MMRIIPLSKTPMGQRGVVLTVVAIMMVVFIGIAAIAIDLGYAYFTYNELQNAADAGALAGASVLFASNSNCEASGVPYCCCTGLDAGSCSSDVIDIPCVKSTAIASTTNNKRGMSLSTTTTVDIGHYAFASSAGSSPTFTINTSSQQLSSSTWESSSFADLNSNTNFINAVRVTVYRTDVPTFFAKIFGFSWLKLSAQATAYIGFAGQMPPGSVNEPLAICEQAITNGGTYTCNDGRMLNSGNNIDTANTAGWTDFNQQCVNPNDSNSSTNSGSVPPLIGSPPNCSPGNPYSLVFGSGIGTNGGTMQNSLSALYSCWQAYEESNPNTFWSMTLPVVDCSTVNGSGNNINGCPKFVGAVTVNIVWIINQLSQAPAPTQMEGWGCPTTCGYTDQGLTSTQGQCCWNSFVSYFNLVGPDFTTPALSLNKTIYFLSDCNVHTPVGGTGGENFGILAKYPVLVNNDTAH